MSDSPRGLGGERDPKDTRLAIKLYNEYKTFFAKAERERRWNPFEDVAWDKIRSDVPDDLALCAETFCAVEMYLPDYVAGGLAVVRPYMMGALWFQINWGYEESKHALSLTEFLLRSGARTDEQMVDLQQKLWAKKWTPLFTTGRQMTIYGCFQEQATFVFYCKQREAAAAAGHETLRQIYDFIARDEIAHARYYEGVVKVLLEEDREGTMQDLAIVSKDFKMPAFDLVPDYDDRVLVMRDLSKMDRDVFLQKVYFPVLKQIGVTRAEIVKLMAAERDAAKAMNAAELGRRNAQRAAA